MIQKLVLSFLKFGNKRICKPRSTHNSIVEIQANEPFRIFTDACLAAKKMFNYHLVSSWSRVWAKVLIAAKLLILIGWNEMRLKLKKRKKNGLSGRLIFPADDMRTITFE